MRKIFFNSSGKIRAVWRLAIFLSLTFLINISLQMMLQNILEKGLTRGYVSASIYFISVITSLFVQIKYIEKSSFKKYGLDINTTWLQEFSIGGIIPVIQLSIFFALMYWTGNLEIVEYFTTASTEYSFISGFISEMFGLLVGSSVEEIFFRAFLFFIAYDALQAIHKDGEKRAFLILLLISPLFGLAHIDNEGATLISTINLSLDAMMMCLPFVITGRLGMSIGMHFSWNLVQGAIFGFPISGNIAKASILRVEMHDNIITGGTFGPEGSILFILLDIIAVLIILYWKKRKNYTSLINSSLLNHK